MSWVKIDDGAPEHPKLIKAGMAAGWLWVCGLAFCNRQRNRNGIIPKEKVLNLFPKTKQKHIDLLVKLNLWETLESGDIFIHDYFDYQPKPEELQERREKRKEAGKLGGIRSGEARREATAKQSASATYEAKTNPDPDPDPDPIKPSSVPLEVRSPKGSPKAGSRLTESYQPTEATLQQCRLLGHSSPQDLVPAFIDYWIAKTGKDASKLNWEATFRNWVRSDLKRGYQGKKQLQRSGFAPAVEQTILAAMGGNNEF